MIVLSMTVLLAIAGALPAAAAPPAPLSGQALPVAGRPAKAGVPQRSASQRMTADAATVDATWTSLMAVNAQFDTDSVEFALTSDMDVSDFVLATYGLAAAEVAHGGPLDQDPDSDSSTDPLGEGFELWPFTITEDDLRLVIQARNSEIDDLDMYVMRDANQDGFFDIDEELTNWSWNWDNWEQVDLRLPEPGNYLLAIHAYWGSGTYDLLSYRITTADQNLSAGMTGVPDDLIAGNQYVMQYHWSRPIDPGTDYFGIITLGDGTGPTALGFQRVNISGDTPAVNKVADRDLVARGGMVNYAVTLTNAAQTARAIDLEDAIPEQMAVDPNTVTGGATLANGMITWNGELPGRGSVVQVAPGGFPLGGYVSLAGLGVEPLPVDPFLGGDDEQVEFDDLPAFRYLGNEHSALCMMSNGYLVLDGCRAVFHDIPYIPYGLPSLPEPLDPNNMIAPLWTDLDLASDDGYGGGLWYAALVNDGVDDWLAFEWEDVQRFDEPDTAFTFQVWLKVGDDQVFLVYHQLTGALHTTLVGAENDDGTAGASYFYNNGAGVEIGTPPQPGTVLQVTGQDPQRPTHVISYWAQALAVGEAVNTVNVASGEASDSASASVTIDEPAVVRSRRYAVTMDSNLNGTQPDANFGQASTMWVGFQDQLRPVAWADIPVCDGSGCIPAGSSVDVAYLYLYVTEGRGFANWDQSRIDSVTAHALLSPWTQDGATWVAPWQVAGGDLGPPLGSTHLGVGKVGTWLRFDVTAYVQQVVAGVSPNYGFVLTSEDDTWDPTEAINGVSYGLATSQHWDASKVGYLRVMYRTFTE
jgi:uncharacterized repeat protein (TIGR01451 family)